MTDPNATQFEARLRSILEAYSLPGRRIVMGVQTPLVLLKDDQGKVLLASNNLVPLDGTAGFAKGCIFLKTDALTLLPGMYVNIGTTTACAFASVSTGHQILYYPAVPASGVAVHAAVQESAVNAFPGPFTQPTIPRNLQCVFDAGWQGGDVTVTGTDQFAAVISEVFTAVAGTTVEGNKVFASITGAAKTTMAGTTDAVNLQTGTKLGIPVDVADAGILVFSLDPTDFAPPADCPEAFTLDLTYNSFIPETVPDGAVSYKVICNI